MTLGISNVEIWKKKKSLLKNMEIIKSGVLVFNHIKNIISFHGLMKEQNAKYPFIISNIDKS